MGLVEILVGPITSLLDKFIPDKGERERMAHEIATLAATQAHDQIMAQMEVNKQEAQHASLFVAGWRPSVGWVCSLAMAWQFILYPIGQWLAFLYGVDLEGMPKLDSGELMTILLGMLGLGSLRTFEKNAGLSRSTLKEK